MKQKLENMTTAELVKYFFSLYHELEPEPKRLEISSEGIIILDPNNNEDLKWWYGD